MSSPCSCSCGLGSPPDSEPGPIHRAEPWPLALLRLIRPLRRRLLLGHRQVRDSGWVAGGLPDRLSGRDVNHRPWHRGRATRPPRGQSPPHRRNQARLSRSNALSPDTTAVEGSGTLEEWSMVQKQVTAQGWLMSTPEGDAPDPTLTRWGLAGCRQLDPQPSRSCHSRRSAC